MPTETPAPASRRNNQGLFALLVFAALLIGGAIGTTLRDAESALVAAETVGGLWLDALRMTVVPLLVSLVVVGVAAASDAARTGRLAAAAVGVFMLLMTLSGAYGMAAAEFIFRLWPIDPEAAKSLQAAFGGPPAEIKAPSISESIRALVPTNPIAAAAEDAILPLVLFSTLFGFAATRLSEAMRAPLVALFQAVSETMVVIVGWVLALAPVGVFALALAVGGRAGVDAGPVLLQYVLALIGLQIVLIVALYALPALGGVSIGRFIGAVAPVQALAASTQSSLACLPAMVQRSRDALGLPDRVIDIALPLGVALFRVTGPAANVAVAWFIVTVNGVEPTVAQIAIALFIAPLMSAGAVGLPGQVSFFTSIAPIALALGAPIDLLAVLLAVEVFPDIFRTVGNVTGHMGVAALLSRERK